MDFEKAYDNAMYQSLVDILNDGSDTGNLVVRILEACRSHEMPVRKMLSFIKELGIILKEEGDRRNHENFINLMRNSGFKTSDDASDNP